MISKHIQEETLKLFFEANICPIFTDTNWANFETVIYQLSNVLKLDAPELCEAIEKVYIEEFDGIKLYFKCKRFYEQLADCMISDEEEKAIKYQMNQYRLTVRDRIMRRIADIIYESEVFTDEPLG